MKKRKRACTIGMFLIISATAFSATTAAQSVCNISPPIPRPFFPGNTYSVSQSDGCETSVSSCAGGNVCKAEADIVNSRLQIETFFFTAIDGTKRATGKIFNRFRLEGDPSVERILRANISGDVSWAGRLSIEGGGGRINSYVEIWITLIDETDNNRTIEETTLLYDECDISAVFPTACLRFPQGSTTYNIAADLQRGHTYRLSVAARCTSDIQFPAATAGVACTFYDDVLSPNGVSRAAFRINIEKDLEEEIERLREDVDRLQDELGELRELFRDHSHLYKTGRGEGHNSENATSSSPIRSD